MREALILGISHYEHGGSLFGCVDDAHAVTSALERHGDGTVNFDCMLLTGTGPTDLVERNFLKAHVAELFKATETSQPWTWDNLKKSRGDLR